MIQLLPVRTPSAAGDDLIATLLLGIQQPAVRQVDELTHTAAREFADGGDPDADADAQSGSHPSPALVGYLLPQALRQLLTVEQSAAEQGDRELLATPAGSDAAVISGMLLQQVSHLPENLVACQMAVRVVHLLELIDVKQQQRDRHAGRAGLQFTFEQLRQVTAVEQAGEVIGPAHQIELGRLFTQSRSEEHTSELQSRGHLVCRLLLAK